MKQFNKLFLTILFVFAACFSLMAQNKFFKDANQNELSKINGKRTIIPQKFRGVSVNTDELKRFLWSLPNERNASFNRNLSPIMELPMPNGHSARFRVWESSIQEPGLEAKFPEIKTFLGQGIDDPFATIRFDFTDFGFHAQIRSITGNIYMDPYSRADANNYISYYGKDNIRDSKWSCEVADNLSARTNAVAVTGPCRGTQLYTYRLAVGCTHEYAQAVGGTTAALLHSAIVTTVNRVVGVYEDDFTVRMVLVANNNIIEFLAAAGDPYTGNDDPGTLINESQTIISSAIGSANFDIGHTFSTGGGGLAGLGVVCNTNNKASGVTGITNPVGDDYDIDYVSHEMGHQFGGNHTFNSTIGACGGGNRNASTAYEVGSGTTIMAYAGICSTTSSTTQDNTQDHSDPYFHTITFDEVSNFVQAGGSCKIASATNNNIPVITSMGTSGISIPAKTPFVLTGTATDADGDPLTYDWEEWDLGTATTWNGGNANTNSPLFKSQIPNTTGSRSFPSLAYILAGFPTNPPGIVGGLKGETMPTTARVMKFRLTVRDNRAGGGGIVTGGNGCGTFSTPFTVNIVGTTAFTVAIPNGGESWAGGSLQTITWNVANTNAAPVNTANVKITLSTDGGLTYPTVIAASTANDGTESVTIPSTATTTARIRVEAVGNIFYDISNADFTITAPAQTYTFNSAAPATIACGAASGAIVLGSTATGGFSTVINLTATGNPAGTTVSFSTNPLTPGNNTTVTLSGTNTLAPGTYNVTVTGVAGAVTQTSTLAFTVSPGTAPAITTQPVAVAVCAGSNASFTAASSTAGVSYQWQVSTGGPFTDIAGATSATFTISGTTATLNNNQYHVIVSTLCGTTTSNNVVLTINTATAISTQPADAAVCAGTNNTFTVTAAGTGLSYQWQQSITGCAGTFINIAGATSSSYVLSGITVAQNGYAFRAIITGSCAPLSVTSDCAALTVTGSVNITTQPADLTICSGADAVFTVAASGSGVNYQWQVSTGGPFTNIAGATSATLTVPAVTVAASGSQYQAVVTNTSCAIPSTSGFATLTVNALPAVSTQPASATICVGSNTTFTAAASGTNISYQWQVSSGGPFTDIAGATSATYTVSAATAAMNNNQYHVVISGTCSPAATSANAILTVVGTPVLITQPSSVIECEGFNISFTVAGASAGTDLYQWQASNGGPFVNIPGATSATLTIPAITVALNGTQYQAILSNASCAATVTSNIVTLTVNASPAVTASADATAVCTGNLIQLTAAGADTYSWTASSGTVSDPAIANPTANPAVDAGAPGTALNITYTVIGSGTNGCEASSTVTVTANPLPVVTLTANPAITSLLPGQSTVLTATVTPAGTYTYNWQKGGSLISNTASSLTVNAGEAGLYTVTADDGSGSCAGISNGINVTDSTSSTHFFYIYPNPNNGLFTIAYPNPGGVAPGSAANVAGISTKRNIIVYDSRGARVYTKSVTIVRDLELISVDLRPAAAGTYIIAIYDGSGNRLASEKVVIQL